jgi:glycosyltransferase involved in cell wall biosynthesis
VYGTGSIGRIVHDLQVLLLVRGHQSLAAFGREPALVDGQSIRIGGRLDNYRHVARTRLFDTHGFGSVSATKLFIAKIIELKPDLIHLHNLHGYYLHIGLLFEYLKKAGKPVFWTLHDCWAFTGHCTYFDMVGCNRWQSECYDCPAKSDYPKSILLDRSRWNYRQKKEIFNDVPDLTITTPSAWLGNLVKASFLQKYPVVVIHNGIDMNVFKPTQSDFRRRHDLVNQFVLLGVASSWVDRKGYKYFVELAKQLRPDEKIVLVGVTKRQIKDLPPGFVGIAKTHSTQELAEIYSAADVLINPTLEDNFPTTNLEALACGTPVVTFNTGGSPESLDEGCGLVVAQRDLQGLLAAIATVRKKGRESYATHCQKRVEDWFNKDERLLDYVKLYESKIKRANPDTSRPD